MCCGTAREHVGREKIPRFWVFSIQNAVYCTGSLSSGSIHVVSMCSRATRKYDPGLILPIMKDYLPLVYSVSRAYRVVLWWSLAWG